MFEMLKKKDMDGLLEQFRSQEDAILLDVRDADEYAEGHIPDFDTPLYVYCLSGGRSAKAALVLRGVGYTRVFDLGGINRYTGQLEK